MQKIFDQKFNEFNSLEYKSQNFANTSAVLLFKEYLKRMHSWYVSYDKTEKWNTIFRTDVNHNIVYMLNPKILENIISLEDFKSALNNDTRFDRSRKALDIPILYAYLCYEAFKNHHSFNFFESLLNPYEPVIKLLTRGNHIVRGEMGTIEIDMLPIFKDLDFSSIFLPSYDDAFLNYIDSVCIRSGSGGIPNPEKTNQLWEEFQKSKGS